MIRDKVWLEKVIRAKNPKESRHAKIRLDKSERTINFNDKFFESFLRSLTQEDFIAYPETGLLIDKLCRIYRIKEDNIFLSPGVDAAIKSFFEIAVTPGDKVLLTKPCFPMYNVYAGLFGAKSIEISYKSGLRFDFDLMLNSINDNTSLIILANPNSPIGNYLEETLIEQLVKSASTYNIPVLIDEAYYEYSPGTSIGLINKYENLGISRTFSKAFGGAGIRIGYVIGDKKLIEKLSKWRLMYEVNQIGIKFAVYLLDHSKVVSEYAEKIKQERDLLVSLLTNAGYDVISSECNWIHFHGKEYNSEVIDILDRYNVLFKSDTRIPFDDRRDWIRLTIGPGLTKTPYMKAIIDRKF